MNWMNPGLDLEDSKESFRLGFEIGVIWQALEELDENDSATFTIHFQNVEMVMRVADAKQRRVKAREIQDDSDRMIVTFSPIYIGRDDLDELF